MKKTNKILSTLAFCAALAAHADTGSTSTPAPGNGASSSGMSSSGSTSASDSNAGGQAAATSNAGTSATAPAGGTANAPAAGTMGSSASLSSRQSVMDAQQALVNQGFSISVDGMSGPQTRNAVRQFQARQGLPETGTIDEATMGALRSGGAASPPSASDTSAE